MKKQILCLVAGLVAFSPVFVQADDAKGEKRPSREEMREKFKNMTPEEREAKLKEWREKNPDAARRGPGGNFDPEKRRQEMQETAKQLGLDPEELKKMEPEERMKKIRETADKKRAELKEKKANGTLTEEDKKLSEKLDRMAEMRKRFEENRPRDGKPDGKGDPRDARRPRIQDGDKK